MSSIPNSYKKRSLYAGFLAANPLSRKNSGGAHDSMEHNMGIWSHCLRQQSASTIVCLY
jgi:hypothetical protein